MPTATDIPDWAQDTQTVPDWAQDKPSASDSLKRLPVTSVGGDIVRSSIGAVQKALGITADEARGALSDAVDTATLHPGYGGNLTAAVMGKELPVDVQNRQLAAKHPYLAAASMTAQGAAGTAPFLLMADVPAIVQRATALGFSAQMIAGVKDLATQYGEEMGKPEAQRDQAKIAQLRANMVQTGVFAPLAGAYGLRGKPKPPTPPTTGAKNASTITSPESVPQPEVRPPVGEETPLPTVPAPTIMLSRDEAAARGREGVKEIAAKYSLSWDEAVALLAKERERLGMVRDVAQPTKPPAPEATVEPKPLVEPPPTAPVPTAKPVVQVRMPDDLKNAWYGKLRRIGTIGKIKELEEGWNEETNDPHQQHKLELLAERKAEISDERNRGDALQQFFDESSPEMQRKIDAHLEKLNANRKLTPEEQQFDDFLEQQISQRLNKSKTQPSAVPAKPAPKAGEGEEKTEQDFINLGRLQRDAPEKAMGRVLDANGGGVLDIVEPVGDLLHRMNDQNTFDYAGYDTVKEKVERGLRALTDKYGFDKEFNENIRNNAKYDNVPEQQFREKLDKALLDYANEHRKLPTFNRAQKLAQEAAVALGEKRWGDATIALQGLNQHLRSQKEWVTFAREGLKPTPSAVVGKGETTGKVQWLKTPSVSPGGKPHFWNAYQGESGKGMPFMRVVWDRASKKWSVTDPNQLDSNGRSKELASFSKEQEAKNFVEKQQPTPQQGAKGADPIETLNKASQVKITPPKGATMVRVTDAKGKMAVQSLANVQGENVFKGAGIKKIEAGTIGKDKKFIPMKGEVKIESKKSRAEAIAEFPKAQISRAPGAAASGEAGTYSAIQQLADQIEATGKENAPINEKIAAIEKVKVKAAEIGDSVKSTLTNVLAIKKALWDSYVGLRPYTEMQASVGRWFYALQKADFEAREFGKQIIKAVPDKARREAITNWIQADGDDAVLRERAAASKPQYRRGYELAQKLTPREVEIAQMLREYYDRQLEKGISEGLLKDGLDNYITQVWKKENPITRKLMNDLVNSKLQPNFKYARKRIFDSYFEGEQAGFKPMKDAGALVANYDQTFNKALAARAFIKDLHEGNASDGRPLVEVAGSGRLVGADEPKPRFIIKPKTTSEEIGDYKTIDHPALRGWKWLGKTPEGADVLMQGELKVHPEIYAKLRNRLSTSWFRQHPVPRGFLNVQSTLKQSMMSISGFHVVQENLHALGHRINPIDLEKLDFSEPVTKSLVEHGLQLANHDALEQFGEGLSSGKILNKIPWLGSKMQQYNDWLFQDNIPRLKLTMAKHALERNKERYADSIKSGKITPDQVLELTASQSNHAFGELPYNYWGRNPNLQDFYRTFLLAPDFLEARGGFVGQTLKPSGLGAKGLLKNEQGQALAILALTQYMIARITNQIIDNDPHWELKNAFRIISGNHAYSLRTVPGDVVHLLSDPRGFIFNRLSPMMGRGGLELATQRDYRGVKRDFMQQMKDLLMSGIPISMRIRNGTKILESFGNAFGVQNQRYDAVQNIHQRADDFKKKNGITTPYETVYDPEADAYNTLRNAIERGDQSGAKAEYQKLAQKIAPAKIQKHFKESLSRPFTGSKANDAKFYNSLDEQGKQEYKEAKDLRAARLKMVESLGGTAPNFATFQTNTNAPSR